jgi:hypothetical protein
LEECGFLSLRDLEPLVVFFVAFKGMKKEDEQFHRMSRALPSFCQSATLIIHLAQVKR